MPAFDFEAIGTHWSVDIDTASSLESLSETVRRYCAGFESRFSRFRPGSETNAFREASAGTYRISREFATLLERASQLRELTDAVYDPAVGSVLEAAGYGGQSGLAPIASRGRLPAWSLAGEQLTIDGPIAFDLGGIGKGYAIDQVASIVRAAGHEHFIVDGGGDMFGTMKKNGDSWRVAIEYPGRPDTAAGVVELRNRGLAVSDGFRRRFGNQHHLIHPATAQSIRTVIGCAAVATDAWSADCMTSGLFLALPERYADLAHAFQASFLVFGADGQAAVSGDWPGEVFFAD